MTYTLDPQKLTQLKGELFENESLASYTTWRVGGPAKCLYKPADLEDLSLFLSLSPETEVVVFLGQGSNVLVRDKGFSGTVIVTSDLLHQLDQHDENRIYADAGVSLIKLILFGVNLNLCGMENMAGIPGTVGGALAMNAGAYGSQTWDYVDYVKTIDRYGQMTLHRPQEYEIGYRYVNLPADEWFVGGVFKLQAGKKEESLQVIQETLAKRKARQPLEFPNAGSVFRNPPGDYSARLIEASGLKGYRIGGASISSKHVNFIVNDQNATADDIENLIYHVVSTVQQEHGIKLLREVRILTEEGISIDHGET